MVYKVSYVVQDGSFPGAVITEFERPEVGSEVIIGKVRFEIIEVNELMPPRGDFAFLHATLRPVDQEAEAS